MLATLSVVEFCSATVALFELVSEAMGVSEAAKAGLSFNALNDKTPPIMAEVFNVPSFIILLECLDSMSCISLGFTKDNPKAFIIFISVMLALTQFFPDL